jgi:HK97 family phage portal protein
VSVLQRFLGAAREDRSISFQDVWGRGLDMFGAQTTAGVVVNDDSALALSAVYGSVRILSEGISKLPIDATMGKGAGAVAMPEIPLWLETPSPATPHIGMGEVIDQLMVSALMRGTGYALTPRDKFGNIIEISVLDPDKVTPVMQKNPSRVVFKIQGYDEPFTSQDVAMMIGLSKPGALVGMSPIDNARETIGLGLAAQTFGAALFGNSAVTSGVIEVEGEMSEPGAKLLSRTWNESHKGPKRAHKVAILTEGAKYKPISMTAEQAQFLATREFQVSDVARIFGVPPHLLQDASGSTSWGSGLAEQSVNFVVHSLRPWATRVDRLLTRLAQSEASTDPGGTRRYLTLSLDHLTRGDFSTRISTYGTGLDRGIWNLDEVRAMENLPAIQGGAGQDHRVPLYTGATNDLEGSDDDD